jgi:hypothetical protein
MSRYFTVEWKIEVLFRNGTTDVTHGIFAGPKSVPEKAPQVAVLYYS